MRVRRISKNELDQLWLIELGKKLELAISTQGYRSIYDFWLNCSSDVVSRSTLNSILAGKSDPKITSLMALSKRARRDLRRWIQFRDEESFNMWFYGLW